jgi:tellurite methyltransferase
VIRTIEGFHADDQGDWVAELSCLHGQHVRHQPPFRDRPWVLTESGRTGRVGTVIDCPLCDRVELPAGLELARTAGPFDQVTLPAALRRDHRVADRTWAVLRVLAGSVVLDLDTSPPFERRVEAGEDQPIPPDVIHRLRPSSLVRLEIDFLVANRA